MRKRCENHPTGPEVPQPRGRDGDVVPPAQSSRRAFLKVGGVFTDDLIDAYIELKMKEVTRLRMTTHPIEVEMYYSL